jgi:thiaminase/transcriptional activator TenA
MTGSDLVSRYAKEWLDATHHPFLDATRDGSVPPDAFHTWLQQDYVFVSDLLRFQARLLSVAPRGGQRTVARGLAALEDELGWFEVQAKRLNLQLDVEHHPVTAAYRERLASYADDWMLGITALWTGERAYLDSWSGAAPSAPAYREFVEHWTHPEFGAYVRDLEALVDASGADEEAFLAICRLERDFWEMAWNSARA